MKPYDVEHRQSLDRCEYCWWDQGYGEKGWGCIHPDKKCRNEDGTAYRIITIDELCTVKDWRQCPYNREWRWKEHDAFLLGCEALR